MLNIPTKSTVKDILQIITGIKNRQYVTFIAKNYFLQIDRYCTLSQLYTQLGFLRKAAFFRRIAAMQCVTPQNPRPNWQQCYHLMMQSLEGYKLIFDIKDIPDGNYIIYNFYNLCRHAQKDLWVKNDKFAQIKKKSEKA